MKFPTFRAIKAKLLTSDDVAAALTTNAAQLVSSSAELADMEAQRSGLLLNADDAVVDAHEARLVDARRLVARLEAQSDALEVELAEIGAREAEAAIAKRRDDVAAQAAASERWLRDVYPVLARQMVEGMSGVAAAEKEVDRLNDALLAAGSPLEPVSRVEFRVHGAQSPGMPLLPNTRLLAMPDIDAPGWGSALGLPWLYA